jgi:hypothetical protein
LAALTTSSTISWSGERWQTGSVRAASPVSWNAWQEEVVHYLERWAFMDEEGARRALPSLRRPFTEAYIFCYHHGRMLLEPGMRGPGRDAFVGRLLTEQVSPSELRSQFGRVESG